MPTNKNDSLSGSYKDFGTKDEATEAEREVATLAAAATKRIHFARLGVFLLITAFGALVSYYTYQILHSNEVASYEEGESHSKTQGSSYVMSSLVHSRSLHPLPLSLSPLALLVSKDPQS